MTTEIHHEYTDEIVCPHCGEESSDSWECSDSGTDECCECGKDFAYQRDITVSYSTYQVFCRERGHKWKIRKIWEDQGKTLWRRVCHECNESQQQFDPEWGE